MSLLSDFEDSLSRAVEGMFAGVFRSPVQPAELAKALARAMDRERSVGVGKVYAPNVFTVLLSPEDDKKLGAFEETLAGELSTFLLGHARERGYELAGRPLVRFLLDEDLKIGRYEVFAELVSPDELEAEMTEYGHRFSASSRKAEESPARGDDVGPAIVGAPVAAKPAPAAPGAPESSARFATVTVTGIDHDVVLRGDRVVVGRLASCDICLQDRNVSRQHAAFEPEDDGWAIADLGSTNGTLLNGSAVSRRRLRDGDVVTVGVTELVYHGQGA